MYYLLKFLSYSPIFNVVGSDKNYGDIYKNSENVRISLLGFTIIYYYAFISLSFNKSSREFSFCFKKVIKYPIYDENDDCADKIVQFNNKLKELDPESLKAKIDVIQYRIESQNGSINTSITKASIVLPIFIAIFIYIMQTKLIAINISNYSSIGLFIFFVLILCYLATSADLLFFLLKLTKVSAFVEIPLLKSITSIELLKEKARGLYEKFVKNKNRSINRVSYNIWVQDFFKKYLLYGSLLYLFILLYPHDKSENTNNYLIKSNTKLYPITFQNSSTNIDQPKKLLGITDELLIGKLTSVILLAKISSLNKVRINYLTSYIALYTNQSNRVINVVFSTEIIDSNKVYLIIDRDKNE